MKRILLVCCLLLTLCNVSFGISYCCSCGPTPGGSKCCGTRCVNNPNGSCTCSGPCTQ